MWKKKNTLLFCENTTPVQRQTMTPCDVTQLWETLWASAHFSWMEMLFIEIKTNCLRQEAAWVLISFAAILKWSFHELQLYFSTPAASTWSERHVSYQTTKAWMCTSPQELLTKKMCLFFMFLMYKDAVEAFTSQTLSPWHTTGEGGGGIYGMTPPSGLEQNWRFIDFHWFFYLLYCNMLDDPFKMKK